MSRSGYTDDCEYGWEQIMWRGAVTSAIRGKRGQQLLRELAEAMDAMPVKRLISHELVKDGEFCALGLVGAKRGLPIDKLNPEDSGEVAKTFDIAEAMAREVVYVNDDDGYWRSDETPEQRWQRVRKWVAEQIKAPA